MNKTIPIVIGILVLLGIIFLFTRTTDAPKTTVDTNTNEVTPPTETSATPTTRNAILLSESTPGSLVTVQSATLTKPGYIVISAINGTGDSIGEAKQVGLSNLLPAGSYSNVQIQLQNPTLQDQTLVAVLYQDDGNGTFSQGPDRYLLNSNAAIVSDVDVVGVPKAQESPTLQLQIETFMERNYPASTSVGANLPG